MFGSKISGENSFESKFVRSDSPVADMSITGFDRRVSLSKGFNISVMTRSSAEKEKRSACLVSSITEFSFKGKIMLSPSEKIASVW